MLKEEFIKTLSDFLNKEKLYVCERRYIDIGEGTELESLLFHELVEKVEKYWKEEKQ